MFYSQFILAKKGPLGTIWIAAHLERKLRKNQVADTDIGVSVDSILSPEVPIALRLSSHLLLGVVRIYSKKVNYLFDDCSEALLKVKQAFRSAAVDLPPEQSKAPYHSITLPETFDLDDFELPDNEMFQGNFVDHHVSTREQITLQDTMDGVSFPTSQFGPDERFGDGDASQIGLDLDEELFMDKEDGAGTSGILVGTNVDPLASTKESSHSKSDEVDEEVSDPPLASNINFFNIQAPPTPGLTEEPNLPSAKEEVQVSDEHMDDHMDEDQNASELVVKEVSGTTLSPMEPSDLSGAGFCANGNFHYMEEDNEHVRTPEAGSVELISSGVTQPATFKEHLEANIDQDNVGIPPENEGTIAADVESKECFNVDNVATPVAENSVVVELQGCDPYDGYNKIDVNGTYHPLHDTGAEDNRSFVDPAVQDTVEAVKSVAELQNSFQPCAILQYVETSVSNIFEKSSALVTPVLQACTSKHSSACDGVDKLFYSSDFPAQEDVSSFGTAGREGAINVSGTSLNVGDGLEPTSRKDQITHEVTCAADSHLKGSLDNLITEENHFEKENNLEQSNFPPPELLLFMPNLPAGPSHNFFVDSTPGKEVFAKDGDSTHENLLSGRKRSFTESSLTIQSFNSVESSGGAQSKGTVGFVPDDNDLLSSILVGRRSIGFKMKPSPPVPDTVRAKRQRTAVRSVHKRKLPIDESTVLHGDTIRQQLTNTEDIRRVRKKAPCTHLEVWVLQKQFLEDEIFSESVFTGMFPALRSLDSAVFDLNGIRICRDDRNKESSEAEISTRLASREETETIEDLVPSIADICTGSKLNEETEVVETLTYSVTEAEALQISGGCLLNTPCEQEPTLIVDGSIPLEETQRADNDVMNKMSHLDVSGEKTSMELDDIRIFTGDEAMQSVASGAVPESSVGCDFEGNNNSTDYANIDSTSLNKSTVVTMSMHINVSGDQRSPTHCTIGENIFEEKVTGSGTQDQGLDVSGSEKVNIDEGSAVEHKLEMGEGFDSSLVAGHRHDNWSLLDHDSMACLATDQVEVCHLDGVAVSNKDVTLDSGLRHDGSYLTSNNAGDHVNLNSSFSVEMDLGPQKTSLIEMEGPSYWEDDSKIAMDSTSIRTEFIDTANAEFGTDIIEHDTDFLNVDDDDDAEDYESEMPDTEEKRILDNSGWSSRTRAVANYLQVLFEKEYDPAKRVVSLDNLLVGKTRKEASRMFFETLVLKTKDYIQAEQDISFCNIKVKPRGKLLKSEFGSHS